MEKIEESPGYALCNFCVRKSKASNQKRVNGEERTKAKPHHIRQREIHRYKMTVFHSCVETSLPTFVRILIVRHPHHRILTVRSCETTPRRNPESGTKGRCFPTGHTTNRL